MDKTNDVDSYISKAPKEARAKLKEMRAVIKSVVPNAIESISYKMPYYNYKGRLAWFAMMNGYIGLYLRPPAVEMHKRELADYVTTKSAIHFPLNERLPVPLIKKLIRYCAKRNEKSD